MDLAEAHLVYVGVNLGGGEAGMSEHLLNSAKIGSMRQ